jgi:hypothetical protein
MIITAYIPLSKKGIKLLPQSLLLESVLLYLGFPRFLGIAFGFILQWCIDGISVVIRQTILQLKPRSYAR